MAGGKIEIIVDPDTRTFGSKLALGLRASTGIASAAGQAIGVAITAGAVAAAAGLKKVVELGIAYQNSLNTMQAVTGATAEEMERVGRAAKDLGSDLSLPATSAVDAAAAMTELAKGGLSVDQAMTAARGTLQLAAAAQIDAARAAQIQSNALNTFSLDANQAGRVADVLANTANAATGEITDFADAFQQGGAVAAQFGLSIEDTATSLALLANRGIQGSDAGTLLKSALLALSRDTKPAKESIAELGLTVFDAQGKFVGMESILGQLRTASQNLTQEQYVQATSTLFGSDAARLAGVAASSTAEDWDTLSAAVSRSGGASEVAAAKTKGVGGALEGVKSQLETIALSLFDVFDEPLEQGLRSFAAFLDGVGTKLDELAQPGAFDAFVQGNIDKLAEFGQRIGIDYGAVVDFVLEKVRQVQEIGANAQAGLRPVVDGAVKLFQSFRREGGVFDTVAAGARLFGDAVVFASGALEPIGKILGTVLSVAAELPAPLQAVGLAFLAFQGAPALAANLGTSVSGLLGFAGPLGSLLGGAIDRIAGGLDAASAAGARGTSGLRQFSGEMRVQRALAEQGGQSISRFAAAQAAFETSTVGGVVALRSFRDEFQAIKAGAEGAGVPVSNLSAAIGAFAAQNDSVKALRESYLGASGAVAEFGGKVEVAATRSATALSDKLIGATNLTADAIRSLPARISGFGEAISAQVNAAVQVIAEAPSKVADAGSAMKENLGEAADGAGEAFGKIESFISDNADKIQQGLSNLGPRALAGMRSLGASVSNGLSSATAAVGRFGTAIANGVSGAARAIAGFPARLGSIAGAVGNSFRAIPGIIGGAVSSATSSLAAFGRAVQTGVIGAFRGIPGAVGGAASALSRFAAGAAGAGASLGTGLARGAGSLVGFLGGPWGVAFAGASLALQFFASQQQKAAKSAAEHKAAIETLKGTLDQYTGAVTDATVAERAKDIASRKLSDGTTTFDSALGRAGITLKDFTEATSGNQEALGRVNSQLFLQARALVENSDYYKIHGDTLLGVGADLDTVTAAAIGNEEAFAIMTRTMQGGGPEYARQQLAGIVGELGELGSALGSYNADLVASQEQTRLAAEASKTFSTVLDGIKIGFAGLANGAAPTALLAAGFRDLSVTATDAATRAGEAAAAIGGVSAGAAQASNSMLASRDAFIAAATEAGLTAAQAAVLADQMGLIPEAARIIFETNATGTAAEFITLQQQLAAVPGAKQITVDALSEEAQQKLRDLGLTVTTLPNGQILIDAKDEAGRAKLDTFLADTNASTATLTINANPDPATGKITGVIALGDGSTSTITLDGNPTLVNGKTVQAVRFADNSKGTVTLDANPNPATGRTNGVVAYANRSTARITVDANTAAATGQVNSFIARFQGRTIDLRVSTAGRLAQGGILTAMHDGGVVGFARGGTAQQRKLRPMRAGVATVVPPNTWRVVGDRLVDDEAYIPINKSRRSMALLEETARRMGRYMAPIKGYADGGVAMRNPQAIAVARVARTGSDLGTVVAAISGLRSDISNLQRSVTIQNQIYNPTAESGSDSIAKVARRQAALGMFG